MCKPKAESVYEEARRGVAELNSAIYKDDASQNLEREFVYTEGSYACGISFGEIDLWDSENDDRIFDEDTNELEPLRPFIVGKMSALTKTMTKIVKGIK